MALGFTQPVAGMSNRNTLGGKARPGSNADNIVAIRELNA
jgi:hypothetical protein